MLFVLLEKLMNAKILIEPQKYAKKGYFADWRTGW